MLAIWFFPWIIIAIPFITIWPGLSDLRFLCWLYTISILSNLYLVKFWTHNFIYFIKCFLNWSHDVRKLSISTKFCELTRGVFNSPNDKFSRLFISRKTVRASWVTLRGNWAGLIRYSINKNMTKISFGFWKEVTNFVTSFDAKSSLVFS